MSTLALRFLGPPRVELGGVLVPMKRRKPLALLAFLAVTGERQSRDALAELLYPGQDRDHGYSNLRQCLFLLRAAIGDDWVAAESDGLAIASGPGIWVDLRELRRLLGEGRSAERNGDGARCLDRLESAATLCRGDFLQGFYLRDSPAFEDWQRGQEDSLRRERGHTLARLVELHEEKGGLKQAIKHCAAWLTLDPLEEGVHRRLMLLHALAGDKAAALRQYQRCREVLSEELGEDPDPETEQLRARIVEGKIPAASRSRPSEATAPPPPAVDVHGAGLLTDPVSPAARSYPDVGAAVVGVLESSDSVHVRSVIHTGPGDERARWLLELAHHGQTLLSSRAAQEARGSLPRGASLTPLGVHRLRDLGQPVDVFQLMHPSLPAEFAPLRSLDRRPNNLPDQPTAFLGRSLELGSVVDTLRGESTRLVTLTGPGGSGKTRLALQAAAALVERFEHGAFFVDLSAVTDPAQLPASILAALRVAEFASDRPALEVLKSHLRRMELLLVLDNFEQLLQAVTTVAELVQTCPKLKVLATSREPLHLRAEHELPVAPFDTEQLSGDRTPEELGRQDAVRLFVERALAVQPGFALTGANAHAVAEICSQLDGLPLAIELAAALVKLLAPAALLERMRSQLALPASGARDAPARQRTLDGAIGWSYDLLGEGERALFRRLSAFAGGFTLEAVEAVCSDPGGGADVVAGLLHLVDKSLVRQRDAGGHSRYQMLQTVREYAQARLERNGEGGAVRKRYAAYFVDLAEHAEPMLYGPDQTAWLQRLDAEYGNLGAVLGWLRDQGPRGDGLRLAAALGWYWFRRARYSEGDQWLGTFRSQATEEDPPELRAKLAYHQGWIKTSGYYHGKDDDRTASACFRESLRLYRVAGTRTGIALCLAVLLKDTYEKATTREKGVHDRPTPQTFSQAEECLAIARESGDPWVLSRCLNQKHSWHHAAALSDEAERHESLALARRTGDSYLLCESLLSMAELCWRGSALDAAEKCVLEALEIARRMDDKPSLLAALAELGMASLGQRRVSSAKALFREALRLAMETGARGAYHNLLGTFDLVARVEGKLLRATRFWAAAVAQLDNPPPVDEVVAQVVTVFGLDPETARAEYLAGYTMTLEQAVVFALSDEEG